MEERIDTIQMVDLRDIILMVLLKFPKEIKREKTNFFAVVFAVFIF